MLKALGTKRSAGKAFIRLRGKKKSRSWTCSMSRKGLGVTLTALNAVPGKKAGGRWFRESDWVLLFRRYDARRQVACSDSGLLDEKGGGERTRKNRRTKQLEAKKGARVWFTVGCKDFLVKRGEGAIILKKKLRRKEITQEERKLKPKR